MSFAVLPNPVPDRQPCSALCRMAFLGPLIQTEITAGFPEKVSDWTVIHFYPRHKVPGDSEKPVNEIQSLSRKPVIIVEKQYFPIRCCSESITLSGKPVKTEFVIAVKKPGPNRIVRPDPDVVSE